MHKKNRVKRKFEIALKILKIESLLGLGMSESVEINFHRLLLKLVQEQKLHFGLATLTSCIQPLKFHGFCFQKLFQRAKD